MASSNFIQQDLYFGRSLGNGVEVSDVEFQAFVESEITSRFPGATLFDAERQTVDEDGNVTIESTKVVTIILEDTQDNSVAVEEVRSNYQSQFEGTRVLQVTNSDEFQASFTPGEDIINNDDHPEFIRATLYSGRFLPSGGQTTDAEFQSFVDEEIAPRFPSLTLFDAEGQTVDADGNVLREKSDVISIILEDTDLNETAINEISAAYRDRSGRPGLLVTVDEDIAVSSTPGEDIIDNDAEPELIQADLFFGRDISGSDDVSQAEFESFVEDSIAPRFPGSIVFDAQGKTSNEDGTIFTQESQLVRLIIEDTQANEDAIAHILNEYQHQFSGAGSFLVVDEDIDTQTEEPRGQSMPNNATADLDFTDAIASSQESQDEDIDTVITPNETTIDETPELQPNQILESDLTVQVDYIGTMPFELESNGLGEPAANLGSPVSIENKLYLIDQNDAIYRSNGSNNNPQIQQIFNIDEAPEELTLDGRESILNIAPGSDPNSIYVMFTSDTEPTTDIPISRLPDPLPEVVGLEEEPVDDLYNVQTLPESVSFFDPSERGYQVLYEYKLGESGLTEPRPIAAFETQYGITTHSGGGMLTLPDGRILFATGDALTIGADGRSAPQDPTEHVGKLLIIDPDDGSFEVAAQGLRNVQHLELVPSDDPENTLVAFANIGGVTAEEINYVSLHNLLDTSTIENFGWGRNSDGLAREGTFYIEPGVPLVLDTSPPVGASAPSPEPGFIQPQAQYGRNDPNGGIAISGPVTSRNSFDEITGVFSDLSSSIVYATTDPYTEVDSDVFRVNLIDENGTPLDSLQDLAGGRADPRFFQFPDGSAGVLLEATGDFYQLSEVDTTGDFV